MPFLVEHRRTEAIVAKPATTLPADALGDTGLLAVNDFPQTRNAMADGVLAHLDTDIPPAHLMRHRSRRAGSEEGVEDEIAGVGGDVEDT